MLATPKPKQPLIDLLGVGVKRMDNWLIHDIDLTVKEGDIIGIIGANGSGKSTLVKTLLGLYPPTKGQVNKRPNTRLAYVPQRFSLPQTLPLTVDNLLAQSLNRLTDSDRQRIHNALNIATLSKKQVGTLSGGELQRVLLAKALFDKPDVLVLDEPAQGLDVEAQRLLYGLLDTLPNMLACALVVVSHDLPWVMQNTRHVICLNKHICCQGTPQRVSQSPDFLALFGNLPTLYTLPALYKEELIHKTTAKDHHGLA